MRNFRFNLEGRWRFISRAIVDGIGILAPISNYKPQPTSKTGKRILIFNWRDIRHTYAGGAEVYAHELAKRWAADGHHVAMFCGNDGNNLRHETIEDVHIIRRGGFWFVYVWAFFYYMFRFRGQYDVIIDCHNGIPFFTPLFAREQIICVVHHVHQEIFDAHLAKPLAIFAKFLESKVMPRTYKHSQYVAVSPSTRNEMIELGIDPKQISIVYNGVDLSQLTPAKKNDDPIVLFLGRLQTYKSVDILIKSFKKVLHQVPNAKLVIAGSGDADEELRAVADSENFSDGTITFAGRVTNDAKIRLFQDAWVMVNPSRMEGWGITTIEANACATLVIGADVPGLRDSIRHNETGYLVPHGDIDRLAHQTASCLLDHEDRATIASNAQDWAQEFQWDKSAHKMMELIRSEDTNKASVELERAGAV